jgi:release factor glutamine methyltransferase
MTIKDTLKLYTKIESDLILAHVLKQPKEYVFLHSEKKLTPTQQRRYQALCARRLKGEPLAYIVGYKDFYRLRFIVNKHVLIPRPETEWLIERGLDIIHQKLANRRSNQPLRVLDMGTGSGCLSISLAKNLPNKNRKVYAVDISPHALLVARKNAKLHNTSINFVKSDLWGKVKGKFDLVIANLPYVTGADYRKFKTTLKYEPKTALVAHNNFRLLKEFITGAKPHLNNKAAVLMEIDPKAKPYLIKQLRGLKLQFKFHKDLNNLWRYCEIKTPG